MATNAITRLKARFHKNHPSGAQTNKAFFE
jgi:hypothetical protein